MVSKTDYSQLFYYDETSPTFLRHLKDKWAGFHMKILIKEKDSIAGWVNTNPNYAQVSVGGKNILAHRVVLYLHGIEVPDNTEVDHIDGNPSNNSINNLRVVSTTVNRRNKKKQITNSTGVTGVGWLVDRHNHTYAMAYGVKEGKQVSKAFSVKKLGIMVAFRDAVIHRQKMIEELNSEGAGYTERHGN